MFSLFRKLIYSENGQALILFAFGIAIFLGFAAITVDYGYLAWQKRQLQNAADAGALAAAWELPSGEYTEKGRYYTNYNEPDSFDYANLVTTPKGNNKAVEVRAEKSYKRLFGQIFKIFNDDANDYDLIYAIATAEKASTWAGEALPFINLDDDYSNNPKIEAWENTTRGRFESIWGDPKEKKNLNPPSDYHLFFGDKKDDHSKTYFTIDYQDGITVTNGTVANLKQEIGYIYEQNKPVYIFSLSSDAIKSGKYSDKIKNHFVIPEDDLVLLKVTFDSYDYSGKTLYLTIINVFDLGNDSDPDLPDYPDEVVRLIKNK